MAEESETLEMMLLDAEESTTPKPVTSLLSLNDDCLLEILNFLSLKDNSSVFDVCKRLRILSTFTIEKKSGGLWERFSKSPILKNCYRWYWTESAPFCIKKSKKWDRLFYRMENADCGSLLDTNRMKNKGCVYAPPGDIVAYAKSINVVIRDDKRDELNAWEIFYTFPTTLKSAQIEFESIDFKCLLPLINKSIGERNNWINYLEPKVENKLEKVSTIGFWDCRCQNFYELILKHCQSMSTLVMHKVNTVDDDGDQFLLQSYPNLLNLQCCLNNKPALRKLSTFLQRNPRIKSFTWHFNGYTLDEVVTTIQIIVEFGISLEKLFLSFADINCDVVDLEKICVELQPMNDRTNFKRMELDFDYLWLDEEQHGTERQFLNIDKLTSLKKLTGLYRIPQTISDTSLRNLTALHLKIDEGEELCYNEKELVRVAQNIPNVEELIIYGVLDKESKNNHFDINLIQPFVANSPNMEVIIVHAEPNYSPDQCELHMKYAIQKFNQLRKTFAEVNICNVRRLKVCFRKDVFNDLMAKASQKLDNTFVEVKPIHIVDNVFNIDSPFKKFSYYEL